MIMQVCITISFLEQMSLQIFLNFVKHAPFKKRGLNKFVNFWKESYDKKYTILHLYMSSFREKKKILSTKSFTLISKLRKGHIISKIEPSFLKRKMLIRKISWSLKFYITFFWERRIFKHTTFRYMSKLRKDLIFWKIITFQVQTSLFFGERKFRWIDTGIPTRARACP